MAAPCSYAGMSSVLPVLVQLHVHPAQYTCIPTHASRLVCKRVVARFLSHSLTLSLACSLAHSLAHSLARPLTHSLTCSLIHEFTASLCVCSHGQLHPVLSTSLCDLQLLVCKERRHNPVCCPANMLPAEHGMRHVFNSMLAESANTVQTVQMACVMQDCC